MEQEQEQEQDLPNQEDQELELINPYCLFVSSNVPNWLMRIPDISHGAKLCYGRLCQYAGQNGKCFPTQRALAEELSVTRKAISAYIRELKRYKLIISVSKGLGKSNEYKFVKHEAMEFRNDEISSKSESNKVTPKDKIVANMGNVVTPPCNLIEVPPSVRLLLSTKENQLREKREREDQEPSLSSNNIFSINDNINLDIKGAIDNIRTKWKTWVHAYNLNDKTYISDSKIETLLADPLFDFDKLLAQIAVSNRLRGIGRGNSKSNTVTLKAIVENDNFRQQIMDGVFSNDNVVMAVVFDKSKESDFEVFKARIELNKTFQRKYNDADLVHYHEALESWARRNNRKSADWIEEAINFMRLDSEKDGLKIAAQNRFHIREGYGEN